MREKWPGVEESKLNFHDAYSYIDQYYPTVYDERPLAEGYEDLSPE